MTLNLTIQKTSHTDFTPRITVIGVGGGGCNAVNNMIALNLPGVDFVAANTDAQQLQRSLAEKRIQLGPHLTQGNGAGGRPEIGKASADEAADELYRHLEDVHMVFITAGMGGGTGTGAAPVIARMAREKNILTVGVVTKPFAFEGKKRMRAAEEGIAELQAYVDTLIVIPNQNLFKVANERTGWKEAFEMADNVLYMGVRGVTDLMVLPGIVNLDYADIRSVMSVMGKAMMGTGEAEGEDRAIRAAEAAISNPLLEDTNMSGAHGLLINITGGSDVTLFEVDQAAHRIGEEVDKDANIMFGMSLDEIAGRADPRFRGRDGHRQRAAGAAEIAGREWRQRRAGGLPAAGARRATGCPTRMSSRGPALCSAAWHAACPAASRAGFARCGLCAGTARQRRCSPKPMSAMEAKNFSLVSRLRQRRCRRHRPHTRRPRAWRRRCVAPWHRSRSGRLRRRGQPASLNPCSGLAVGRRARLRPSRNARSRRCMPSRRLMPSPASLRAR